MPIYPTIRPIEAIIDICCAYLKRGKGRRALVGNASLTRLVGFWHNAAKAEAPWSCGLAQWPVEHSLAIDIFRGYFLPIKFQGASRIGPPNFIAI